MISRLSSAALLAALVFGAPVATAQSTGSCALGTAQADLDVNGVDARLYNKGNLFFDGGDSYYKVPKESGIDAIFASTLWVGGVVDGGLRVAAASYAQGSDDYEFWPGPLDANGNPPADCEPYDRIWRVSRTDVAHYERTGVATDDLAEWPAALGAPFFDVGGDGAYDLEAGDRPAIRGEQMAWWVMNDVGGPHRTTLSEPVGLEIEASAFAAVSAEPALHYTTFYRYELTYRGVGEDPAPLDSAYFGVFVDPALGDYFDNYVATDSLRSLVAVYNSNNDDGVYGTAPPALGLRMIEGPVLLANGRDDDHDGVVDEAGERGLATAASWVTDDYPYGYEGPEPARRFYNLLQCRWGDGSSWKEGGYGYCPTCPPSRATCWVYPNSGTPEAPVPGYWSEVCPTPDCEFPIEGGYGRFHIATGPFRMRPGETVTVTYALVWARGDDNFDSLQRMKLASDIVERAYTLGALDSDAPAPVEPTPPEDALRLAGPSPNPFRAAATFTLTVPEGLGRVRVVAYDVLGREVAVLTDGPLPAGDHTLTLDGRRLPAGFYLVRFEAGGATETRRAVRIR